MLLYSPRWLFLYPGTLLMFFGLIVGLWLMPGPRSVGGITLNVHTLLYAAMAIIVGYQAITFAIFTKGFALMEGLIPESPLLNKLFNLITLEGGLIIGSTLLLAGLAGSIYAVGFWGEKSFGQLDPSQALRIIIPSFTLFTLGFQTVLSSFFLSMLGLRRR
jgi:hypothetical protein